MSEALHRVVLEFDDGLYAKLVCPPSGCEPAGSCRVCGRDLHDPESTPCYDCRDAESWAGECWIKTWFDDLTPEELLYGRVEIPVSASWDGDHVVVEIVKP